MIEAAAPEQTASWPGPDDPGAFAELTRLRALRERYLSRLPIDERTSGNTGSGWRATRRRSDPPSTVDGVLPSAR